MSLVNDMLRDLDQRRKSSDSSGAAVKLMPASDQPEEKKNRSLMFLALGLVVIIAGLIYFWVQQSGNVTERQLDIQPRVVSSDVPDQTAPAAVDDSDELEMDPEEVIPDESVVAQAAAPRAAEGNNIDAAAIAGEGASSSAADADESSIAVPQDPVSTPPAQEDRLTAQSDAAPENQQAATQGDSSTLDIRNQEAAESIKNDAQMSAEEQDTMTVQQALRMIADNNTAGAYAHLEQHIINNRYAHKSRETYAKLLMNEGELLAAYNLIESGLALAPNHPGYKKVKARVLIADGQINEAVELLSRRAPAISEDIEYHEILATAQLASRDFEGAALSYTSLVQQDQSQGKWWYGFAASHDSMGNREAARQAYNRAVQQGNLSPNLRRRSQERLSVLNQ